MPSGRMAPVTDSSRPDTPATAGHGAARTAVPDVAGLRAIAERVARAAGHLVRDRGVVSAVTATKSSPVDVVTETDLAAEALIRRLLRQARPDDGVLGEEEGWQAGASGVTWVVDPIDGTVNYLYGIPAFAVSIAAVTGPPDPEEWTVLAGAVHSVTDGHTWTAGRGEGATLDGAPVRCAPPRPLAESLVGTGFGYVAERRRAQAAVVAELLPLVRDVRRIGSAAIDLCLVGSGSLDLYYERGLNPWDMAAASLVAEEAGARVSGLRGRRASPDMTVAGPEPTVGELVAFLEARGADSDDLPGAPDGGGRA